MIPEDFTDFPPRPPIRGWKILSDWVRSTDISRGTQRMVKRYRKAAASLLFCLAFASLPGCGPGERKDSPGDLLMRPVGSTQMACPDPRAAETERHFLGDSSAPSLNSDSWRGALC